MRFYPIDHTVANFRVVECNVCKTQTNDAVVDGLTGKTLCQGCKAKIICTLVPQSQF